MAKKASRLYEPETLRRLQKLETAMLREFAQICGENHLDWFVSYGTALGAVRHKGFIPWDDDIDICMFRKDFEKFAGIVSQEKYAGRYELISAANSDAYLVPEAHWQLRGTRFVDRPSLGFQNVDLGIFLDLFILDNLADDPRARRKQKRDCFFRGRLLIVRALPHPIVPFSGVLGALVSAALWVLHYLMAAFRVSPRRLYRRYNGACTRFSGVRTEYVANFRVMDIEASKLTLDEIYPLKKLPFEDFEVNVVNRYDVSLRRQFGDYMQLPPEEKRHNHCPEILDFGTALEDFSLIV